MSRKTGLIEGAMRDIRNMTREADDDSGMLGVVKKMQRDSVRDSVAQANAMMRKRGGKLPRPESKADEEDE